MTLNLKPFTTICARHAARRTTTSALPYRTYRPSDSWDSASVSGIDEPTAAMRTVLTQTTAGWNSLRQAV